MKKKLNPVSYEQEKRYRERFEAYLACERHGLSDATDQIAFELRMMQKVWGLSIVRVRLLESALLYQEASREVKYEFSKRKFFH